MVDYVNDHRLAGLSVEFKDPKRLVPNIQLDIYVDENDLRKATVADNVKAYMKSIYNRKALPIGKSLYGSVIGRDLLLAFPEITYLEVKAPENNIKVADDEYIDMHYAKFCIRVNDKDILKEW